ncbi:alpha/beta fold hydrolase [Amycolatopsis sp. NPDC004625]|uniref:thioesterase II family protein n=1 Tax=Amycolatopsis sp. NPDC004625 TaxID=3154670 RepID=UPI0033A892FC
MTERPDVWLQCTVVHGEPRPRLVCFPHAGGSASFFRDWGRHLGDLEVHAVRYPGRAERLDEPPPEDLARLGREIAEALLPLADRPIALFGHSLGAVVALETARSLEAAGVRPAHLFASGARHAPYPGPPPGELEDDDTTASRLAALGGTDPELAADPLFQELVLPYVRSDGRMFHAYGHRPEPLLRCPVTSIVGDADVDADRRPWAELTEGTFRERNVRGDHFYLVAEPPYPLVRECLGLATR